MMFLPAVEKVCLCSCGIELFLLMAATGLRISEICGLSVRDVGEADEKEWKALHVTGKGQKEREVYVSAEVWVLDTLTRSHCVDGLGAVYGHKQRCSLTKPVLTPRKIRQHLIFRLRDLCFKNKVAEHKLSIRLQSLVVDLNNETGGIIAATIFEPRTGCWCANAGDS